MLVYEDVRAKGLVSALTETITGVPVETTDDNSLRRAGYSPILLCVCVTEPCDCPDNVIVWVPESAVQADVATGRKSKNGEELHEYSIDGDAPVAFETFRRAKAGDVAQLQQSTSRARADGSTPVRNRRSRPQPRNGASGTKQPQMRWVPKAGGPLFRHAPCNDYEIDEADVMWTLVYEDGDGCIYCAF